MESVKCEFKTIRDGEHHRPLLVFKNEDEAAKAHIALLDNEIPVMCCSANGYMNALILLDGRDHELPDAL